MSHERSETIQADPLYQNIYGQGTPQAGKPLPPIYGFEKAGYQNIPEAVKAAMLRSKLNDVPGQRVSSSDFLRTNPMHGLLQQLLILHLMQQHMQGRGGF